MNHDDEFGRPGPRGPDFDRGPRVPPPVERRTLRRPGPARRLWGWALRVVLSIVVVLMVLAAATWFLTGPPLVVHDGTWIELRHSSAYPEQRQQPSGLRGALESPVLSAQELAAALRRAARDPRIEGVLLHADGFAGGWAQAHELRERLIELRARGKRVLAWSAAPTSIDYFLATGAERIFVAPEGVVWIGGLQAQLVFLRDALEKAGIAFESVAVGEYKSAPETFTEDASSEANRRQIMDYLDDVFEVFTAAISEGRGLTPERVRTLVDRSLFDARQALGEGLIDEIGDLRTLIDATNPVQLLDPLEYLAAAGEGLGRGSIPEIALVHVTGTIVGGRSGSDEFSGEVAGHETVVERLRRAGERDEVRAVVVRIDSPGGSALASDLVLQEIRRLREHKPVVVSMGETAASGGYYVAMEADEIWADPLTLTGSIGVFLLKPDLSGAFDKLGLRVETYRRGENAGLFDTTRGLDEAQRARLQEQLDRFYLRFVEQVADGRELPVERAEEAARGRVWSGQRARAIGLVDGLGGVDAALAAAARRGGIDEKVRPKIVTFQPEPRFLDQVLQNLFAEEMSARTLPLANASLRSHLLSPLQALGSFLPAVDGTPQFLLPWRLRIR